MRYTASGLEDVALNAAAPANVIEAAAWPDAGGAALLRDAADRMRLTARGFHRTLKVARTIADLDGAADVGRIHLAEALPTTEPCTSGSPPDAASSPIRRAKP